MTHVEEWVLTGLLVAVGLFVVYEMLGLSKRFLNLSLARVHTISYYAKHHRWLNVGISVLIVVAAIALLVWWGHHMTMAIPK